MKTNKGAQATRLLLSRLSYPNVASAELWLRQRHADSRGQRDALVGGTEDDVELQRVASIANGRRIVTRQRSNRGARCKQPLGR